MRGIKLRKVRTQEDQIFDIMVSQYVFKILKPMENNKFNYLTIILIMNQMNQVMKLT